MKRTSVIAAAMLSLFCLASCERYETRGLRIVQYNVGAFSKVLESSIPMIADMMQEIGADAISLNELDSCNARHDYYQLEMFAETVGEWDYRYGKAFDYKGGGYGVGVTCKDAIIDHFTISLDKADGAEYRACCVVETDDYVLASTHLDHVSDAARLSQARTIASTLKERYGKSRKPVFLCGDLNATPESETVMELLKDFRMVSVTEQPTFEPTDPQECIDYIMVLANKAKVNVIASSVMTDFETGDITLASDHMPVCADVQFAVKASAPEK